MYTYTEVAHFSSQLNSTTIKPCESVEMKVTVINIGTMVASEVVQFYATFMV